MKYRKVRLIVFTKNKEWKEYIISLIVTAIYKDMGWQDSGEEEVEEEDELGKKWLFIIIIIIIIIITLVIKKIKIAHKSTDTRKGWLLVLEIILGKLGAIKKGKQTSDKKTLIRNEKIRI